MAKYAMTLETLKNMDKGQLKELFHDLNDKDAAYRIMDAASDYICKEDDKKYRCDDEDHSDKDYSGKSEYDDWKEQDDAQRYRDIQSDLRRPY